MNFKTLLLIAGMTALSIGNTISAETRTVWLDEIKSNGNYVQDWGRPEVNRSVVGTPLSVGGTKYKRGIGAHAISRMLFDLGGKAVKVEGLDTNPSYHSSSSSQISGSIYNESPFVVHT